MREHAKSGARAKKARGGRDEEKKEKEKWRLQTTQRSTFTVVRSSGRLRRLDSVWDDEEITV